MPKPGFKGITISEEVYNKIELLMEKVRDKAGYRKFRSVTHFVEDAVMRVYEKELVPLEHFNLGEDGVKILDRSLGNKHSRGKVVDVYFKPDKVMCDYCGSSDCKHVKFALSLPQVQSIIRKKGWKLPEG